MDNKLVLLVLLGLVLSVQAGKKRRKYRAYRRFPKPEAWMLYSSEYDPAVEVNSCVDIRGPKCEVYANNPGYCHYQELFMRKYCRKSCKWCYDGGSRNPIRGRTEPLHNNGAIIYNGKMFQGCEDLLNDCPKYFKTTQDCKVHSALTVKYCPRTCGHCCSDRLTECPLFIKKHTQCKSMNGFFRKYCPASCDLCDCADKTTGCRSFTAEDCRAQESFARQYCSKSCGFCEPRGQSTEKQPKTVEVNTQRNLLTFTESLALPNDADDNTRIANGRPVTEPTETKAILTEDANTSTQYVKSPTETTTKLNIDITKPTKHVAALTDAATTSTENGTTRPTYVTALTETATRTRDGITKTTETATTATENVKTPTEYVKVPTDASQASTEGAITRFEHVTAPTETETTVTENVETPTEYIAAPTDAAILSTEDATTRPEDDVTTHSETVKTTRPEDVTKPTEDETKLTEYVAVPTETSTITETVAKPTTHQADPETGVTAGEDATKPSEYVGATTTQLAKIATKDAITPTEFVTVTTETTSVPTKDVTRATRRVTESTVNVNTAIETQTTREIDVIFGVESVDGATTDANVAFTETQDVTSPSNAGSFTSQQSDEVTISVTEPTFTITNSTALNKTTNALRKTEAMITPDNIRENTDVPPTQSITHAYESGKTNSPVTKSVTHSKESDKNNLSVTKPITYASENGETEHVTELITNALTSTDKKLANKTDEMVQTTIAVKITPNRRTSTVLPMTIAERTDKKSETTTTTFAESTTLPVETSTSPVDRSTITAHVLPETGTRSSEKTKCQTMQLNSGPPLVGAFYPECKSNGEFQEKQCWGSTGYCWCVDREGIEIPGTKVQFKQPNCSLGETKQSVKTRILTTIVPTNTRTGTRKQKDNPASSPATKQNKRTTKTKKTLTGPSKSATKCRDKRKKKCQHYAKFPGYCTVHKEFMSVICPRSCKFCGTSSDKQKIKKNSYVVYNKKYEFDIKTLWDGSPINHDPIKIKLSAEDNLNVRLEVSGPFFDQPGKPPCLSGQPCWKLWEYEVAEVFFLGAKQKYLELEVSPHGPHLLLLLDGVRKPFKTKLPMKYSATIDHSKKTWNGTAIVPIDYFPPNVRKINAYAIHGPDNSKVYMSLYPARNTLQPDFHQLHFFQSFDFKSMFPQSWTQPMSPFWVDRR